MTVLAIIGAVVYLAGWAFFVGALAEVFHSGSGGEPVGVAGTTMTEKMAARVCALTWPLLLPVVLLAYWLEKRVLAHQERLRR